MNKRASFVSHLLDAESMLCVVEERLKDAAELAIKSKDTKVACDIANVQEQIMNATLALFTTLISIDDPDLEKHLKVRETPIGYHWHENPYDCQEKDTVKINKCRK